MSDLQRRFYAFFLILVLGASGGLEAQVPPASGTKADIIAVVGNETITRELFQNELDNLNRNPNFQNQKVDRKKFLKEFVEMTLLQQESSTSELVKGPQYDELLDQTTTGMLSQTFLQALLAETAKNDAKPIPAFRFHVHQITLESMESATNAIKELESGKTFQELARAQSKDTFKDRGGDRGFLKIEEVPPVVAEAIQKLEENAVSQPLAVATNAFLLVKFSEKQASSDEPPSDDPEAKNKSFPKAAFDTVMTGLAQEMDVKRHDEILNLLKKNPMSPEDQEKVFLTIGSVSFKLADLLKDMGQIPDFIRGQILAGEGVKEFARQYSYRETIRLYVKKHNDELLKKYPQAEKMAKRQARIRFYLTEKMKDTDVTEEEVKEYYSKNLFKFSQPETRSAHHILVKTEDSAKGLLEKIQKGESFEEIAKTESQCPSGKSGGDLGSFKKGQMVPEFETALDTAQIGKAFGPVKTQFGFHIIRLDGQTSAGTVPMEQVKEQIVRDLLPIKQKEVFDKLILDLRKKFPVQEFPERL